MRGYFGIGAERMSKPMNLGALFRTAHAFGASYVFTVAAHYNVHESGQSDTSDAIQNVPYFRWETLDDMQIPRGSSLVGVELIDEAVELPRFKHPKAATYILGPERGQVSDSTLSKCDYVVRIPTQFCVNVSVAAALVMYDRLLSNNDFGARPVVPSGNRPDLPPFEPLENS